MNKTKQRILKTALELFNERGSGNVSTRHVAYELGISPGNLYYHYANKEEIIRALFDGLDKTSDDAYAFSLDAPLTLKRVAEMLTVTFEIVWRYRFFYREMTLLVHNDSALAERYRAMSERAERDTRFVVDCAVDAGLVAPLSETKRDALTRAILVISSHWLSFEEMGGQRLEKQHITRGVALLMSVLEPYLTPQAKRELSALTQSPTNN